MKWGGHSDWTLIGTGLVYRSGGFPSPDSVVDLSYGLNVRADAKSVHQGFLSTSCGRTTGDTAAVVFADARWLEKAFKNYRLSQK